MLPPFYFCLALLRSTKIQTGASFTSFLYLYSRRLSIPEYGHCLWSGIASVFCPSRAPAPGHLGALELQEVLTLRCLLNEERVGTWGESSVSRRANLRMHMSTFQDTGFFFFLRGSEFAIPTLCYPFSHLADHY